MIKNLIIFFVIVVSFSLDVFSQSNFKLSTDLKLLNNNKNNIKIIEDPNNKFLGFVKEYNKNLKISWVYVYEKYIVIAYYDGGYNNLGHTDVYLFDKTKDFDSYLKEGVKVFSRDFSYWFIGIRGDHVFFDVGTGPTVRGLEIADLTSKKTVYFGVWNDLDSKIQVMGKDIVVVYKYYDEVVPIRDGVGIVLLHAFSFNLKNKEIKSLDKVVKLEKNI